MEPESRDARWAIVTSSREGVLATINVDGTPHLSNVYYVVDPELRLVRISTTATRTKGRNLLRDPRGVLHVAGGDFFNFAVVEGNVSLVIPKEIGDAAMDEQYDVHDQLGAASPRPAFDEAMLAARRLVVRLEVTDVYGLVVDR
jgi:PPOX class probable F420-dependent enzyme